MPYKILDLRYGECVPWAGTTIDAIFDHKSLAQAQINDQIEWNNTLSKHNLLEVYFEIIETTEEANMTKKIFNKTG